MEEKKKKSFFKWLEEKKIRQVLFFVVSMVVLVGVFVPTNLFFRWKSDKNVIENLELVTDYKIISEIENVEVENNKINISGWVLRQESKNVNVRVLLKATDGSDSKLLYTNKMERNDIGNYFKETWDFGEIGFVTDVKKDELLDTCYEVLLVLDYEREIQREEGTIVKSECKKFSTGEYLYNEKIYHYNPLVFSHPKINDERIAEVVEAGILHANLENGEMYIYQYENALYWIIPADYAYLKDKIYIPYHIRTSDVEKLPEDRRESGLENKSFTFEKNEMEIEDTAYRVAVNKLPDEYPATDVLTGIYDRENKEWIQKARFQVEFSFD